MSSTFSQPQSVTLNLEGVWLHLPGDPAGTAHNYRYGKALRSAGVDVTGVENVYAGRVFPVVDFGPFEREQVQARAQVPQGANQATDLAALRSLVRSRSPVLFRDGRGRMFLGVLSGHSEQDEPFGTTVSFTVSRVDG